MSEHCFVYVIQALHPFEIDRAERHLIKIGISDYPKYRLSQFATACPFPLRLKWQWRLPYRAWALQLERELHDLYARERTNGEWFLADISDVFESVTYELMRHFCEFVGRPVSELAEYLDFVGYEKKDIPDLVEGQYGRPDEWHRVLPA